MAIKIFDSKSALYLILTFFLFVAGCGCNEKGSGTNEADAQVDAGFVDVEDAKVVDASPPMPDGSTQHDFCDEPFFKLPIDGPTQATYHLTMWKDKIVYSVTSTDDINKLDIHLMDLSTCVEKQISYSGEGVGAAVDDEKIIWRDSRNRTEDPYHCSDHYVHNLESGIEERLSNKPDCVGIPRMFGDWIAYRQGETTTSYTDLILTKYGSGEEKIIVPGTWLPISPDLSERYLVFGAQTEDSTSMGRDAYYYDLPEESLHRVTETSDIFCNDVSASGDWMMYMGPYHSMQMPFRVGLYNIPEKKHIALSPEEDAIPSIALHENLAAWTTIIYSGINYQGPVDIEMYDIKQETRRKLTKTSGRLRAISMFFPYLVVVDSIGFNGNRLQNDFYVANLVKLGIADEEGNLVPGEGVIEPPEP